MTDTIPEPAETESTAPPPRLRVVATPPAEDEGLADEVTRGLDHLLRDIEELERKLRALEARRDRGGGKAL
jgi:hypothetical protein